jgi:hypothetical protein
MPPAAYALFLLFTVCSVLLGIVVVRLLAGRAGRGIRAYVLPVLGAFGAFYLIGHRMGLAIGPEIGLFGFKVALFGDLAIGFAAALVVALVQGAVVRAVAGRRVTRGA